jgi:hypothetical protein
MSGSELPPTCVNLATGLTGTDVSFNLGTGTYYNNSLYTYADYLSLGNPSASPNLSVLTNLTINMNTIDKNFTTTGPVYYAIRLYLAGNSFAISGNNYIEGPGGIIDCGSARITCLRVL